MKMALILATFTCLLSAAGPSVAEPASLQAAQRGSRMASEQIELPAAGRDARVPLRELVGAPLENRHGTRIGQIEDVVVDPATQRLDYAVVRFDADWLGTSKHVAVPARALVGRSAGAPGWVLDADLARAMSLPELGPDKLGRIHEEPVVQEVHKMLESSPWLRPSRSTLELSTP
jgi:sporulation protein YlmC with PRC-barrel domain